MDNKTNSDSNSNLNTNAGTGVNFNLNYLSSKHFHERDSKVIFEESTHTYKIKGDLESQYTSVTTWNHSHFEAFDSNKIIDTMMNSKNWKTNKYYGKTKEDIIKEWDNNRNEAARLGTQLHYDIECFYNCVNCPSVNVNVNTKSKSESESESENENERKGHYKEYGYFLKFQEDFKHLKPYRTEWMIWDSDVKIAGSVDMVFEDTNDLDEHGNGKLVIYDWKRCKEITKTPKFNKFAVTECISHLPDTNYWHYCLQLSVYKKILEEKYGKKIDGLFLVCLHPSNQSYLRIPCKDLSNEVDELFELRKEQLKNK